MAGIDLGSGFNRVSGQPLDLYDTVADLTARDAIPSGVRYQGMSVFVTTEGKNYQLIGGITNAEWVEGLGGGSGSGTGSDETLISYNFEASDAITDYFADGAYESDGGTITFEEVSPLHGTRSLKITHPTAFGIGAEWDGFPIPEKFRGRTIRVSADINSDAAAGKVYLEFYDNVNGSYIIPSLQAQFTTPTTGTERQCLGQFYIPDNCTNIYFAIGANASAGHITYIDDLLIEAVDEKVRVGNGVNSGTKDIVAELGTGTRPALRYDTADGKWKFSHDGVDFEEMGSGGGVGGTDIMFVEDFENFKPENFNLGTGLALQTVGPLSGTTSNTTFHDTSSTIKYISQILAVPRKFRGRSLSIMVDIQSNAEAGNVTLELYDKTNDVTLGTEQLNYNSSVVTQNIFAWDIPTSCQSVEWKIAYLVDTTGPTTEVDNIVGVLTESISTETALVQESDSIIRLDGYAGYGSSANKIPRLANIRENESKSVLYQDSSSEGASFTILEDGFYHFKYSLEGPNAVHSSNGITKNLNLASKGTTAVNSLGILDGLIAWSFGHSANTTMTQVNWSGPLKKGDVIRPHTDGNAPNTSGRFIFTVSKQGTLRQVNVNTNQKIKIPTSYVKFDSAAAAGSTNTAILNYSNIQKFRGDAFELNPLGPSSSLGTHVRIKKAGTLFAKASVYFGNATDSSVYLTKNQTTLTTGVSVPDTEAFGRSYVNAANAIIYGTEGMIDVVPGDIIRVARSLGTIAAATGTFFELHHQEQEIQVSVSNTLPQFSESDSSVRVKTGSGFGSTNTSVRRYSLALDNEGSDIEYSPSATLGDSWIVKSSGVYSVGFSEAWSGGADTDVAVAKNTTTFTQGDSNNLCHTRLEAGGDFSSASASVFLQKGDVVRVVAATPSGVGSTASQSTFYITKVGKPNVTGVDVTPFVNVPQTEHQGYTTFLNASLVPTTVHRNTGSGLFKIATVSGRLRLTALKRIQLSASGSVVVTGSTPNGFAYMYLNGSEVDRGYNAYNGTAFSSANVDFNSELQKDEYIEFTFSVTPALNSSTFSASATAISDQVLAPVESFSTDTANLQFSSSYNISTLANAPDGTFITWYYTASTNTRVQSASAPTQTIADMSVSGIRIFGRPWGSSGSAATPTGFSIKIGKGLKGLELQAFFGAGKTLSMTIPDIQVITASVEYGVLKTYDEVTGILTVDAGYHWLGSATVRNIGADTSQTPGAGGRASAYIVINASKSPALAGVAPAQQRFAVVSDVKPNGTDGGTNVAGWNTRVLNTLDDPTGFVTMGTNQFTLQPGRYFIEAEAQTYQTNRSKLRLRNITDATTAVIGPGGHYSSASGVGAPTLLRGHVTISSPKAFELQHYLQIVQVTYGFGVASSSGESEVHAQVKITKIT